MLVGITGALLHGFLFIFWLISGVLKQKIERERAMKVRQFRDESRSDESSTAEEYTPKQEKLRMQSIGRQDDSKLLFTLSKLRTMKAYPNLNQTAENTPELIPEAADEVEFVELFEAQRIIDQIKPEDAKFEQMCAKLQVWLRENDKFEGLAIRERFLAQVREFEAEADSLGNVKT